MNVDVKGRGTGFTLVEVMVVIAIIVALAAIIFPVTSRAIAASKQSVCLANLHQLSLAAALYSGDSEDRTPSQTPCKPSGGRISFGYGWAGKIFPYVKTPRIYVCPTDSTTVDYRFGGPSSSVVSFGANENLTSISLSQATSASKTVFLFEVANCYAQVTLPDEGQGSKFLKLSPSGDGVKGSLIDYSVAPPTGHDGLALYATGRFDNSENDQLTDDFLDEPGRHSNGANYLALDGHASYAKAISISAGGDAKTSAEAQSSSGCPSLPGLSDTKWPCAAGTGESGHRLTFSKN